MKYEVWKRPRKHVAFDIYYVVFYKDNYYPNSNDGHELIQKGFRSYEAAIDFINILEKLKSN